MKLGHVVFEILERADVHTDIQYFTPHTRGEAISTNLMNSTVNILLRLYYKLVIGKNTLISLLCADNVYLLFL